MFRLSCTSRPLFYNVAKGCPRTHCRLFPFSEEQLVALFRRFDCKNDGRLSKVELKNAFIGLASHVLAWRSSRGIHPADKNLDGSRSEDELEALVQYAEKHGYKIK